MSAVDLNELRGRSVVVTGSTRGFGRVLAVRLAELGTRVVVSGPFLAESEQLATDLVAAGHEAVWAPGDVTNPEDVRGLVAAAVGAFGGIDVWVNNAAYETPGMARVLDFAPEVWERVTEVNVLGTGRCTLAALERMITQGHGLIVNVTGRGDDLRPTKYSAPYGASKAWIRSFTRTLRNEYAGSGVSLVAFNPGIMTTSRMGDAHFAPGHEDPKVERQLATVTRILGDPPDVAVERLVEFLASPASTRRKDFRILGPRRAARGLVAEASRRWGRGGSGTG